MADNEKFDVIIVGGGPAGLSSAYVAAKAGLQVVVLERGDFCGSKNVFGGIFFTNVLKQIMPDKISEMPYERIVTKRRWSFLTPDGEMSGGFKFSGFSHEPRNNSYTVIRAKFDKWMSEKAEEAGAMILTGAVVDDFIIENNKIKGVKVRMEDGNIYGDIIILADGVNSLLAKKLGMHKELPKEATITGVKEVIALPEEKIKDRFNLTGDEGVAYEYFGYSVKGATGSGFIYTNKDSISIGVGATIKSMLDHKYNPNDLLEYFKEHSAIAPLIRDGEQKEYSAHLIPDMGYNGISKLFKDNVMVVGDAAGFVNASLFHEGTNLAMESGRIAGETAIEAKKKNDYSEKITSLYEKRLNESFVIKDLKKFRKLSKVLEKNTRLFDKYPAIMEEFVIDLFTVDGEPKDKKQKRLIKRLLKKESIFSLIKTALDARRVIL
ncbi:MAG: FAD-dependent oxidoreductase [Candidatus Goldbacteria bacterium]|nr:FAD-dependent oxidoreductase [Candidatus Goldiibacteriota bacterium]